MFKFFISFYNTYFKIVTKHGLISLICGASEITVFLFLLKQAEVAVGVSHAAGFVFASIIGVIGHSLFTFRLGKVYFDVIIRFSFQVLCMLPISYFVLTSYITVFGANEFSKGGQLVTTFMLNVFIGKFLTFVKK